MQRPILLAFSLFLASLGQGATALQAGALPPGGARADGPLLYYDLTLLGLEGTGWSNTPGPYDRLPSSAQTNVPASVWSLSRQSAGLCARFVTDATELTVHWVLTSASLAMPHMPATGVSGVDLYVRLPSGSWRWVANGRPTAQDNAARLFASLAPEPREFCLYLPLYNGVSEVEVGIPSAAFLSRAPARPPNRQKPILFYGTSITQGGCASRPGMVHTAIIGRLLDRPVINLGFSGAGKMEPALADLLAELDPAVFILDCLPNMDGVMVDQRVGPFVVRLRQSHPDTPILLVEDRTYADAFLNAQRARSNRENRTALKQVFEHLRAQGLPGLHYLPGERLLGEHGEDTVDGSHPTDLGFMHQAQAFLEALKPILAPSKP